MLRLAVPLVLIHILLTEYSEAARIPSFSQNFIFRFLRYDKKSIANVLSFFICLVHTASYSKAGEILKEKLEAIGVDPSRFSSHSFRSGGATSAANPNVPDRLFKLREGGNQTQLKTAMFAIKPTHLFMYLAHINLFSFCKSEFRLTLYFVATYTSV